jgi:hypothetical protein
MLLQDALFNAPKQALQFVSKQCKYMWTSMSLGKVCTLGFSEDTAHEIITYQSQICVGMSDEKVYLRHHRSTEKCHLVCERGWRAFILCWLLWQVYAFVKADESVQLRHKTECHVCEHPLVFQANVEVGSCLHNTKNDEQCHWQHPYIQDFFLVLFGYWWKCWYCWKSSCWQFEKVLGFN